MRKFLSIFVLIASCTAYGVPRDTWVSLVEGKLPSAICESKYFKECFKITQTECEATAKKVGHACMEKDKKHFPKEFDANSGMEWGAKVGACTGRDLEKTLNPKKKHEGKCDDPAAWGPGK